VKYEYMVTNFKLHKKDSIVATTPFHILTVTDMSGNSTLIKTYHKEATSDELEMYDDLSPYDKDRLFVLFNDGKDFALIQFYVFDKVLRPLSYFMKPKADKIPVSIK
jgi:hypothetical protein